ncbi:MAG: 30S ribosomal protein S21 [Patescibacteria group bacterium]
MPIIIKAQGNDSTGDVIKKFKKAAASSNVVTIAKDRAYFRKPSKLRAEKKIAHKRLQRRARSLKRMKNISPTALERINERLSA